MDMKDNARLFDRRRFGGLMAGAATAAIIPGVSSAQRVLRPSDAPVMSRATKPVGRKMTPAERADFAATEVGPEFDPAALPVAERREASDASVAIQALFLKGLLHRADPAAYPIPADPNSPEAVMARAVAAIPSRLFNRAAPKLAQLKTNPQILPLLSPAVRGMDFKTPSLAPALRSMAPSVGFRAAPVAGAGVASIEEGDTNVCSKYKSVQLVLRSLHCIRETPGCCGGSDEMVIGAVRIGAGGNIGKQKFGFYAGQFDDHPAPDEVDYIDFGDHYVGEYSLSSTAGYPKNFYCIWQLTETDHDGQDAANDLVDTLQTACDVLAPFTLGITAVVSAVVEVVQKFINLFISDLVFPTYTSLLRMYGENDFGPTGVSKKLRTKVITKNGSKYVIGYRWYLVA